MPSRGLRRAIKCAGGRARLADRLHVTRQAVENWLVHGVPPRRVIEIHKVTGVPCHALRPDLYPKT